MNAAIEIYRLHGGKLLLSGDNTSKYYDEPGAMRRMAVESGIPPEDIVTDGEGISTSESVFRAKAVFGAKSVVVVTQRYHLYRAVYIASSLGLEVAGVEAEEDGYSVRTSLLLREALARIKDIFAAVRYSGRY